ncbi:hypothetical protein [Luteibacter sp.]|uniref:hypothetical protein n=1 Tax=Luteibacter sp. TaxID=1886636 RepID=UPI003F822CBE
MNLRSFAILAVLPATAWGQSSFDDVRNQRSTDPFAVSACRDSVATEVRSRQPMAGNVQVTDADASSAGSTRTDVSGKGTFSGTAGAAHDFTFRCSYDLQKQATTSVSVML